MSSSAVLSTLAHVTSVKLEKLAKQQNDFITKKQDIMQVCEESNNLVDQLRALVRGYNAIGIKGINFPISTANVRRFLDQAQSDPSISSQMLQDWKTVIQRALDCMERRYEYTSLFGRLVIEWVKNPNETQSPLKQDSDNAHHGAEESFERVGRKEMYEQRHLWEYYAFSKRVTDLDAIHSYLDEIFNAARKSKSMTPLDVLRKTIHDFKADSASRFNEDTVRECINGLLASDLYAGEQRKALVDLVSKQAVLAEIAIVLNADLDSLQDWQWTPSPVPVTMRKHINGKYRFYYEEEFHQAILLHFIGTRFAVFLKHAFKTFYDSDAWVEQPHQRVKTADIARRDFFLKFGNHGRSVRNTRRETFMNSYFMNQLPSSLDEFDIDDESTRHYDDYDTGASNAINIKQGILHLVNSEMLVSRKIYGQFTVIQTDFKWFGPSLPHATIFSILSYLNVAPLWLDFFRKYLTPAVIFSHDGQNPQIRTRSAGIPMGHILSDALGEAVMFVLDYAVNRRTEGVNLYRMHDDIWCWGVSTQCQKAWAAINEFKDVMGMELNLTKTGSVYVSNEAHAHNLDGLPQGPVQWGFLKLNSTSGKWIVDDMQVSEHVKELKRQIGACRSTFATIQAYNAYLRGFFANNFGAPAHGLGREHIDMVVSKVEGIIKSVACISPTEDNGTFISQLRETIAIRHGALDVPDGFFFLPNDRGGLNVHNPLIPLHAIRDSVCADPLKLIEKASAQEEAEYEEAREAYREGKSGPSLLERHNKPELNKEFFSFEEYNSFGEEYSVPLRRAYTELMERALPVNLESSEAPRQNLSSYDNESKEWANVVYDSWLLELYGREVAQKFGGLTIGLKELLPLGLLEMLKSEKVRWEG